MLNKNTFTRISDYIYDINHEFAHNGRSIMFWYNISAMVVYLMALMDAEIITEYIVDHVNLPCDMTIRQIKVRAVEEVNGRKILKTWRISAVND